MLTTMRPRGSAHAAAEAAVRRACPGEAAAQLAALRIVTPLLVLVTAEVRHAPARAAEIAALRVAPEGLGWFVAHAPISPALATASQAVCAFCALCAALGLRARLALAGLTVSTFYAFAVSQLSGAVWHDMHLLWMIALLAASPCDEAWAVDARGHPNPADSPRYAVPLLFARLLLGCVYFFPGVHKLHTSGLAWALSDNLRNQMYWKWAEHGVTDAVRFDRVPGLLPAGGLFVLAFELTFPVFALVRRTRPWIACAGVLFHLLAGWILRIPFVSLWALYVVLFDPRPAVRFVGRALARRRGSSAPAASDAGSPASPRPEARLRPLVATWICGSALVAGAAVQGIRGQMRSFPFACYPTFEWRAGTEMPDLLVEAEAPDGRVTLLPHARDSRGYRSQRQWGQIWSLAGVTAAPDPARLRAYVAQLLREGRARSLARGAVRVRCSRAFVSVLPEERGEPPRRAAVLAEFPITP
jgi:hypothetical protein